MRLVARELVVAGGARDGASLVERAPVGEVGADEDADDAAAAAAVRACEEHGRGTVGGAFGRVGGRLLRLFCEAPGLLEEHWGGLAGGRAGRRGEGRLTEGCLLAVGAVEGGLHCGAGRYDAEEALVGVWDWDAVGEGGRYVLERI